MPSQVCDAAAPSPIGGSLGDFSSGMADQILFTQIESATGWSGDQALAWMKQVVSKECPENLKAFDKPATPAP